MSTDDSRGMLVPGFCIGVVVLIKQVSPEAMSIHCIIHSEALVVQNACQRRKKCQLADVMCDVIKIVTTALKNSRSNCPFHELVREMGDDERLVYHSEVR